MQFLSQALKRANLCFHETEYSTETAIFNFVAFFFFFLSTWLAPSSTAPSFITSPSYHSWPIYCNSGSFCCLGFPRIYLSPMIITTITQVYMCGLSLKEIFEIFRSLHLLSCVGDVRHFADFVSRVSESLIIVAGGIYQDLFISKYLPLVCTCWNNLLLYDLFPSRTVRRSDPGKSRERNKLWDNPLKK